MLLLIPLTINANRPGYVLLTNFDSRSVKREKLNFSHIVHLHPNPTDLANT